MVLSWSFLQFANRVCLRGLVNRTVFPPPQFWERAPGFHIVLWTLSRIYGCFRITGHGFPERSDRVAWVHAESLQWKRTTWNASAGGLARATVMNGNLWLVEGLLCTRVLQRRRKVSEWVKGAVCQGSRNFLGFCSEDAPVPAQPTSVIWHLFLGTNQLFVY